MTEEQCWAAWGCEKEFGPLDKDSWSKVFLKNDMVSCMKGFSENEPFCYTVDSGVASAGTIPGLEKVLGLPHVESPDLAAVSQINFDRVGVSMKIMQEKKTAWIADTEESLGKAAFLGGETAS
jgi:hypothetical protein